MTDKNIFLNSKQVEDVLGLTCENQYNEEEGRKIVDKFLGQFHQINYVRWTNVNGEMVKSYGVEAWLIVDVKPYYGVATIKRDGVYRQINIEDLKIS